MQRERDVGFENLPHDLPYQPIILTADEWAHGVGASMSFAAMQIDPLY